MGDGQTRIGPVGPLIDTMLVDDNMGGQSQLAGCRAPECCMMTQLELVAWSSASIVFGSLRER